MTDLANYAHGCKSGTEVMSDSCLLIAFKASPWDETHAWYSKSGQELPTRELISPRGELITAILLNRHSIKMPSKHISLHSLVRAVLRPHQRNFSLQSGLRLRQRLIKGQSTEDDCATLRNTALGFSFRKEETPQRRTCPSLQRLHPIRLYPTFHWLSEISVEREQLTWGLLRVFKQCAGWEHGCCPQRRLPGYDLTSKRAVQLPKPPSST